MEPGNSPLAVWQEANRMWLRSLATQTDFNLRMISAMGAASWAPRSAASLAREAESVRAACGARKDGAARSRSRAELDKIRRDERW